MIYSLYTMLNFHYLIDYPMDQKAMAVAGVCSCNHENSNLDSPLVFRGVSRWLQEQTPAKAFITGKKCIWE